VSVSGPRRSDVSCVVHVHSTYSDGTATVPELLAAAQEAGADALLLTDHDTLAARRDGWAGRHGGVLLVVGTEVSPKQGHYLAFGIEREIPHAGRSARQIAAAVRAAGGLGFAAHPFSDGGHMLAPTLARRIVLPHGWPALEDGCDRIELWSLTTDAAEAWRTPGEAWRWLRDPEAAVAPGPPAHHLRRWDALSARRRLPALGGLDGHAPGIRIRGRVHSPLSHARTFGLLRTHVLPPRPPDTPPSAPAGDGIPPARRSSANPHFRNERPPLAGCRIAVPLATAAPGRRPAQPPPAAANASHLRKAPRADA
jgi:hypothetical protein